MGLRHVARTTRFKSLQSFAILTCLVSMGASTAFATDGANVRISTFDTEAGKGISRHPSSQLLIQPCNRPANHNRQMWPSSLTPLPARSDSSAPDRWMHSKRLLIRFGQGTESVFTPQTFARPT